MTTTKEKEILHKTPMIREPALNEMDLKEMEANKVKEIHEVKVKYI